MSPFPLYQVKKSSIGFLNWTRNEVRQLGQEISNVLLGLIGTLERFEHCGQVTILLEKFLRGFFTSFF